MTPLVVRRSAERPRSQRPGVSTRHTFSFGPHYDPDFTGVGPLVALNEELIEPGAGYDDHRHAGVDVVSWVVEGQVLHDDAASGSRVVTAGSVGVLRAGAGLVHAERCPAGWSDRASMLQSWLVTTRAGSPGYAVVDGPDTWDAGLAVAAAGPGGPDAPLALSVPGAVLRVGRLQGGREWPVPPVALGWLHVAVGAVAVDGAEGRLVLHAGDGLRLGRDLPLAEDLVLRGGREGARLLLWELPVEPEPWS